MFGCDFPNLGFNVEATSCATSYSSSVVTCILSSGDNSLYYVARLKAEVSFLAQTVARRKSVFVGTAHLT